MRSRSPGGSGDVDRDQLVLDLAARRWRCTASSCPSRSRTNSRCSTTSLSGRGACTTTVRWLSSRSRRDVRCITSGTSVPVGAEALADLVLLAGGQAAHAQQRVDVVAQAPLGRDAPARGVGVLSRPTSSRSPMTLRTVAADTSSPYRRVTVCEPTASPVARYSDTTACRIFLARPPISTLFDLPQEPPVGHGGAGPGARGGLYIDGDDLSGQRRLDARRRPKCWRR